MLLPTSFLLPPTDTSKDCTAETQLLHQPLVLECHPTIPEQELSAEMVSSKLVKNAMTEEKTMTSPLTHAEPTARLTDAETRLEMLEKNVTVNPSASPAARSTEELVAKDHHLMDNALETDNHPSDSPSLAQEPEPSTSTTLPTSNTTPLQLFCSTLETTFCSPL